MRKEEAVGVQEVKKVARSVFTDSMHSFLFVESRPNTRHHNYPHLVLPQNNKNVLNPLETGARLLTPATTWNPYRSAPSNNMTFGLSET